MEFDFNQNQTVESLDKVPEQFRVAYVENTEGEEGGFIINPQIKPMAEAISGLNAALTKARRDAKGKSTITADKLLEPLGFKSVEEVQDTLQTLKEQVEAAGEGKINLDKMRAEMEKTKQKELDAKDAELQGMSQSLQRYLIEKDAVAAISAAKGVPDLLLPHIKSQTKVVKDGDEFVVRVVDRDGEARGDGKGGFMSVQDLVSELKTSPTFGRAFESEAPRGGGTPPSGQRPTITPGGQKRELSSTEKIAQGLRNRK